MWIREKEGRMDIRGKNTLKKSRKKERQTRQTRRKEKTKVG